MASALLSYKLLDTTDMISMTRLLEYYRQESVLNAMECMNQGMQREMIRSKKHLVTRTGYRRQLVNRQVTAFLRGSGCDSKWITLLATGLSFYLITYFSCLYSTSNIIMRSPELLDTFEKVAMHPSVSVFFMDLVFQVSPLFEGAPPSSEKGKVWKKRKPFPPGALKYGLKSLKALEETFRQMRDESEVVIVSSSMTSFFGSILCAFSTQDELRQITSFVDEHAVERLYGFGLSVSIKDVKQVTLKWRRVEQSGHSMSAEARIVGTFYGLGQTLTGKSDKTITG